MSYHDDNTSNDGEDEFALPNYELLEALNKRHAWVHVRKVAPLWAILLDEDQEVETLEGVEDALAGDWLCKGVKNELWPQKEAKLLSNFNKTDVTDGDWIKFVPRTDTPGYLAAQVKKSFAVKTKWGTQTGKEGDYLLKSKVDETDAFPEDVWVVDQEIFNKTYSRAHGKTNNNGASAMNAFYYMQFLSDNQRSKQAAPVVTAPVKAKQAAPIVTAPVVTASVKAKQAAPIVTAPVVTAPVVTAPVVTAPVVTASVKAKQAAPIVTAPVVTAPVKAKK